MAPGAGVGTLHLVSEAGLPWLLRASPSATLDETHVSSTRSLNPCQQQIPGILLLAGIVRGNQPGRPFGSRFLGPIIRMYPISGVNAGNVFTVLVHQGRDCFYRRVNGILQTQAESAVGEMGRGPPSESAAPFPTGRARMFSRVPSHSRHTGLNSRMSAFTRGTRDSAGTGS